ATKGGPAASIQQAIRAGPDSDRRGRSHRGLRVVLSGAARRTERAPGVERRLVLGRRSGTAGLPPR
ncbi:MAG TPA: hypothetical protein PKX10_01550, partial [Propioniciclava tarda]|nr:hypothetical protein [Propioniciclava tarda]